VVGVYKDERAGICLYEKLKEIFQQKGKVWVLNFRDENQRDFNIFSNKLSAHRIEILKPQN